MKTRFIAGSVLITAAAFGSPRMVAHPQPPPIIDMHMHALAANDQEPPPLSMCTPFPEYTAAAQKRDIFYNNAARFLRLKR
jgi:hypothetical protein